ncbi:MAG: hypothetical protein F9K34_13845 [Albidovulum sp.]|uniref:TrbG/VirB9 family P-type conjugative transfer protein n=1 Tax=Albidovulum sp. TaxID=1872424 RepID=UPI00132C1CCE|nr:TrbG/VirB9 family P-type conjugative transfer protein [Defluviimonas sp.]KAB2882672.1 MAG: hypothetical protein F9K34_13845 [Defluviimonas sp.]
MITTSHPSRARALVLALCATVASVVAADEPGPQLTPEPVGVIAEASVPAAGAAETASVPVEPARRFPGVSIALERAILDYQQNGTPPPVFVEAGAVRVPYSLRPAVVSCPPLTVCDVELEAGETIAGLAVGDTERWAVEESRSGPAARPTPHVLVKALDYSLATNLVVHTDRRSYQLLLTSPAKDERGVSPTHRLAYYFPDEILRGAAAADQLVARAEAEASERREASFGQLDLSRLNFNYAVEKGRGLPWAPVQVFDDGHHTYIRFPSAIASQELPTLLVSGAGGQASIANWRLLSAAGGPIYKADGVYREARLALGVGRKAEAVVVRNKAFRGGR